MTGRRARRQLGRLASAIVTTLIAAGCASPSNPQPTPSIMTGAATPSAAPSPTTATVTPTATAALVPVETTMAALFTLTSPTFGEGAAIPKRFTCDGDNVSPPLEWAGAPEGAASLALIVSDPDARYFTHWVVYDIDVSATGGVQAGWSTTTDAAPQGRNDFGRIGWGGPCPPSGTHHYVFRLLALDSVLSLRAGPSAADVLSAADGHVLAEATLTGTYRRS